MASINDIYALKVIQSMPGRRWYNRFFFRIIDMVEPNDLVKESLDDLIDNFYVFVRPVTTTEWTLECGELQNLTEIQAKRGTGVYNLPGEEPLPPPAIPPFPGDPRNCLRWDVWGHEDIELPLVRNTTFISGINQWLAVNGNWANEFITRPFTIWLTTQQQLNGSGWTVRPVNIGGDTQHLREATFHTVVGSQVYPNIRIFQRRKLKGSRAPSLHVY